jgi:hypothetical protein
MLTSSQGTHVKDTTDLLKVQPPGSNRLFIVVCVEQLAETSPFTSFENIRLDRGHSPTVQSLVNKSSGAGSTHVSSRPIASGTD